MKKTALFLLCAFSVSIFAAPIYKAQTTPIYSMWGVPWYGDHDPGPSETTTGGSISSGDNYTNLVNGKTWLSVDPTPNAMTWMQLGSASFINPQDVSLSFGVSRTPSVDNSTLVTIAISQTSTLLTKADVLFQINYGSGFVTKGEYLVGNEVAESRISTSTFPVPAGASYKLVNVSGSNSIAYLNEVNL